MGSRMVKRFLAAGHAVRGYNRTRDKAERLVGAGMVRADSPRAVAEGADVVLSCVADTVALRAVALGPDGLLAGLGPGAVWVEMSTVSAAAMARVRPYLLALGPTITSVGPVGAAVTMKIAINLAAPIQMLAFAESVLLAEKAGIDRAAAVEAVLRSVMASPMLKYRGPFVLGLPEEPWFNVSMMQKDVQLALDLAREVTFPLPATALANEMLSAARSAGFAGEDFAAVFHVLARLGGLANGTRAVSRPRSGGH